MTCRTITRFIILASYLLASNVFCQEVYENVHDVSPSEFSLNTKATPLHPIGNTTTMPPPGSTTKAIETIRSKDTFRKASIDKDKVNNEFVRTETDKTRAENEATSWKIDAKYEEPKTEASKEVDNINKYRDLKDNKENAEPFKPSFPLESYYDLDNFEPIRDSKYVNPAIKEYFKNSVKFEDDSPTNFFPDDHKPHTKEVRFPYKFEKQHPKAFYKSASQPESKPTSVVPVSIPAGGLYKVPYALHNGNPDHFERDKEFENFHGEDIHEHKLKKKSNPLKGLIQLMSTLIPIGIIVSALSPNIVTIDPAQGRSKLRKRSISEPLVTSAPAEACRRRILCEIYAQSNYSRAMQTREKHTIELMEDENCSVHRCEDPRAMAELVRWVRRQLADKSSGKLQMTDGLST